MLYKGKVRNLSRLECEEQAICVFKGLFLRCSVRLRFQRVICGPRFDCSTELPALTFKCHFHMIDSETWTLQLQGSGVYFGTCHKQSVRGTLINSY